MERDRGRAQVRAGQADRQLDQPQGGRGAVPGARAPGAALRRRRRRHGLRRAGPGRYRRAQGRDLRTRLRAADRDGRLPAGRHRLRSQHLRGGDGDRGAQRLRARLHRGRAPDPREDAARAHLGRRLEPVVRLPRQRAGARGDALGVPLPRHPGRHGHGHRQRRPARALRRHSGRPARTVRGRRAQPAARRHRPVARGRVALQGRRRPRPRRRTSPGARPRSRRG